MKYKKNKLLVNSTNKKSVLKTEPIILKFKNTKKRYNSLINLWSNTHIQKNFYLATFKEPVNKKINILNQKNNMRYDYDVYMMLDDKVVGIQKVLFVSCVGIRGNSQANDYVDLTLNSVFIVSNWAIVGVVKLVYKSIEHLFRSLQPVDALFDLQLPNVGVSTVALIKYSFYSKLRQTPTNTRRPASGQIDAPNYHTRCSSFDDYFFSNFLRHTKVNPRLEFVKKINFTEFNSYGSSELSNNQKVTTRALVSLYSSLVIINPVIRLFNNMWSLKNINNKLVSANLRLKTTATYKLILKFKKAYFYITLLDSQNRIFFSLHTGMFLKFFNYKKSLKKSKSFKILLMRYLRKLLIVTGINNFHLFVRQASNHLSKLLHILQKPIHHPFTDPLTRISILEQSGKLNQAGNTVTRRVQPVFNFIYVVFVKTKPYGIMKTKKVGRIKRKIRRKVMKLNRISD